MLHGNNQQLFLSVLLLFLVQNHVFSQENYEIQVYSSPTQAPKTSIIELHSNFTFNGEKNIV